MHTVKFVVCANEPDVYVQGRKAVPSFDSMLHSTCLESSFACTIMALCIAPSPALISYWFALVHLRQRALAV